MTEQTVERANILIVDDERIIGKDIELRLKKLGYRVAGMVSTGKKALEMIEASTSPDLILMDVKLKGKIDGIETAEIIRNRFDIPMIYMTAYSDHATLERVKVTEPFGYILKPFNEKKLHSTIEMALYKHKTERKLRENEEWLSTTLRSIRDGVITTDIIGNITFINHVAEELTGMKQQSVLGKQFTETCFFIEEGLQRFPENLLKQVLAGEGEPGLVSRAMLIVKNGCKILIRQLNI
jgi:PAS domain S-box-containing protein